jgi:hypothetical protein
MIASVTTAAIAGCLRNLGPVRARSRNRSIHANARPALAWCGGGNRPSGRLPYRRQVANGAIAGGWTCGNLRR